MRKFNCTPYSRQVVSPERPYLETIVSEFDMDIFTNRDVVQCTYEDRVFDCVIDSVEQNMCSGKWKLTFLIANEVVTESDEQIFNHQKPFTSDPVSKPLHKDTDLGHMTLEIMKAVIRIAPFQKKNPDATNELFAKDCIALAKELIKQLDSQT